MGSVFTPPAVLRVDSDRRTIGGNTLVPVLRRSLPDTGALVLVGLADEID
jgi:hypothetical protein